MSDMYFKSLPDKSTPLIPDNLDKLNDIKVSPTQPTTNEKVWIQKGKNLINPKKLIYNVNYNEIIQGLEQTLNWIISDYIPIEKNIDYIVSHSVYSNGGSVVVFDENKQYLENVNTDTMLSPFKITNDNAKYIIIKLYHPDITDNLAWIQLEQNNVATEYEPYIEKAIHTKNDNGIYEEIANLESKYKLLWKNDNPSSQYNGTQIISLNSGDYDMLIWFFKRDKDTNLVASNIIPKGYGGILGYVNTYGGQASAFREVIRHSDTDFEISFAFQGGIEPVDTQVIPTQVIGVKF